MWALIRVAPTVAYIPVAGTMIGWAVYDRFGWVAFASCVLGLWWMGAGAAQSVARHLTDQPDDWRTEEALNGRR